MTLREAAEQALKDLELEIINSDWCECDWDAHHHDCRLGQIIKTLRAALAEPNEVAAAVAAEREACAKVAELVAREIDDTNGTATYIAKAIRARGEIS